MESSEDKRSLVEEFLRFLLEQLDRSSLEEISRLSPEDCKRLIDDQWKRLPPGELRWWNANLKRFFEEVREKARFFDEEKQEKARLAAEEEEQKKAREPIPALGSQKSSQTINRTEQETPNQSSAIRLNKSSQTINRTDQETPNASLANRLNKSSQTINRAEQETSNEPCVKENDYTNRFGKIDIKPRGKIPSEHTKILQKHYLVIIENIRVDDIMDHLFSGEVLDWNELHLVKTKLKSEGNREALSYLMYILSNSGDTALPIFIKCLHQTGYSHVAELLQNPVL